MSKYNYTNAKGHTYILNGNTATNPAEIDRLRHTTADEAKKLSDSDKTDVFYSLELHNATNHKITKGFYFLIPIDRSEVPNIDKKYGSDYLIGICYNRDIKTEYEPYRAVTDGYQYEEECAEYLRTHGFTNVEVTKKSADHGLDIIAYKDKLKYGFQCKYYSGTVPYKAVQEAFSGAGYYRCNVAVVMTTGKFTKQAKEDAKRLGVKLWQKTAPD